MLENIKNKENICGTCPEYESDEPLWEAKANHIRNLVRFIKGSKGICTGGRRYTYLDPIQNLINITEK